MRKSFALLLVVFELFACRQTEKPLPFLGEPQIRLRTVNGQSVTDTLYPSIPAFSLIDQDSNTITGAMLDNKIYVADFIFLSCPSICPQLTGEMHKVYNEYASDDRVVLLSHTIDPKHDSVAALRRYTAGIGIKSSKWHFLTGNKDSIYRLAKDFYFTEAYPDSADPGNFIHGGGLLLIDRNKHIRGVYDGTSPEGTEKLIKDIHSLLLQQF